MKECKSIYNKGTYTHMFIAALLQYPSLETAKMPHNGRMDQENVVSIHNGILLIHKEE
jgi:hypothetical protein